jgi:hypothetical protein
MTFSEQYGDTVSDINAAIKILDNLSLRLIAVERKGETERFDNLQKQIADNLRVARQEWALDTP